MSRYQVKGSRPKARNMTRSKVTRSSSTRSNVTRSGRPPRALAEKVEERILDAARRVFVERGFEGTSIDQIAEVARAGKPTIYARFPGKEALFTAAIERGVDDMHLESHAPTGTTLEERLASLGRAMLQTGLAPESIGRIRLAIAEARRFPDFASGIGRMARERAREPIARVLREAGATGQLGNARLAELAQHFLDLVVIPLMWRALLGENLKSLGAEIGSHLSRTVPFFLARCRDEVTG
jgi:AcrR family transcriptional regulator